MSEFNLDDLRAIMQEDSHADDPAVLETDFADVDFETLGYDSLAVLDLTGILRRRYGMLVPDDMVAELTTPRALIAVLNEQRVAKVGF